MQKKNNKKEIKQPEPRNKKYLDTPDIEVIKNEYFDERFMIVQPEQLYRVDTKGGRIYSTIDEKGKISSYPSTTTIIKKYNPTDYFLLKWWADLGMEKAKKIFKELSQYGTFQHIILKDIIIGQDVDISEMGLKMRIMNYLEFDEIDIRDIDINEWVKKSKQDTLGIIQWIQDYDIEPIACEITLYSKKYGYAGTLDLPCMARLKAKDKAKTLILVDYKTGRNDFYNDCPIQLKSYCDMWNENYPENPIKRFFNLGAKDYRIPIGKTVVPYRFQEQTESQYVKRWEHYRDMFRSERDDFIPETKKVISDGVVNCKTDIATMFTENDPFIYLSEIDKSQKEVF